MDDLLKVYVGKYMVHDVLMFLATTEFNKLSRENKVWFQAPCIFFFNMVAVGQESSMHEDQEQCKRAVI